MAEVKLMRYSKFLMLLGGVWKTSYFSDSRVQKIYSYISFIVQMSFSLACFLMFIEFFYLLKEKDVNKLIDNVKILIVYSLVVIKFVIFQNSRIPELINRIIQEEQIILTSAGEEIRNIYLPFVKYIDKCSVAIMGWVGSVAGLMIIATPIIGYTQNDDVEKPMILYARFPFDQQKYYGSSITLQSLTLSLGAMYWSMTQILYLSVVTFVKIQLLMLQDQLRCFDDYKKKISPPISDMDMMKKLIRFHQFIIRFVQELNESLNILLLLEFLLSSLTIAAVAFQIITVQTASDTSFYFGQLIVLIAQLFILAWHANDISVESINVSAAAYEFPWYEKSLEVQKTVVLVMQRAQKPLALTIGPFKPLTTDAVIAVMNAAYSYVTIMKTE